MGTFGSTKKPRSLADDFRMRSEQELRKLIEQRLDLIQPIPEDISALAVRATSAPSIINAMNSLNRVELDLCEVLAALPDGTNVETVHRALNQSDGYILEAIDEALMHLWQLGLTWGNQSNIFLVRTVREMYGQYPCALGPSFSNTRATVRTFEQQPDQLLKLLASAPEDAVKILQEMAWANPLGTYPDAFKRVTPKLAKTATQWLLAHELLVPVDDNTVILPQEIALIVRGFQYRKVINCTPPRLNTIEVPQAKCDASGTHSILELIHTVQNVIDNLGRSPVAPLRTGGISLKDFTGLSQKLHVTEKLLALILEIAASSSLIALDDHFGWTPTSVYDQWIQMEDAAKWSSLALTWLNLPKAPMNTLSSTSKTPVLAQGQEFTEVITLRRAILSCLQSLDPDHGTNATTLTNYLQWHQPRADRQHFEDISAILFEAEILGIVGLGSLTTFGRSLTEGNDGIEELNRALPDFIDHIIVQADLTALAPGRLPQLERNFITQIADIESTGVASIYRFSNSSVLRGIEQGLSPEEIIERLTQLSRTPIPQTLTYLVNDIARRHGLLQIGHASVYLRCEDQNVISAILADKSLTTLEFKQIAPGILISGHPREIVLAHLRKAGYSPAIEGTEADTSPSTPEILRTQRVSKQGQIPNPQPSSKLIDAAISTMLQKSPDQSLQSQPQPNVKTKMTTQQTLAVLSEAVSQRTPVWLGYVDKNGDIKEFTIEPLAIENGFVTGFNLENHQVTTFTAARIVSVHYIENTQAESQGEAS